MTTDFDLWENVVQYLLHYVTYAAAKFEAATSNGLGKRCIYIKNALLDLDVEVKVTQDVAKYDLHHVTYSDTKFEASTSDGLGGDAFTKNTLFDCCP